MKVLVINGVNLNLLGIREKGLYGAQTYDELVEFVKKSSSEINVRCKCFQSNFEGEIVEEIQCARGKYDGIIINAGAYSHTSIAILDALKAVDIPTVEVHLTDVSSREKYRQFSYISEYAYKIIMGKGFEGYREALNSLKEYFNC